VVIDEDGKYSGGIKAPQVTSDLLNRFVVSREEKAARKMNEPATVNELGPVSAPVAPFPGTGTVN